jgi:glutamate-1-semialdehyde 2,1-aminomutase
VNLYASIAHTPEILDGYLDALAPVFATLAQMDNAALTAALPAGPAHAGFRRLT